MPANRPILPSALLGLAHAALLLLAFPPLFLPYFALLIPLPALLATRIKTTKPRRAALAFAFATAPAWAFFHAYLIDVTPAGYPFVILILSAYPALFILITRRTTRVLPWYLAAPLAWTAIEFFRGQLAFNGYPWYLTAQPLAAFGTYSLLQAVGVYGVGFLITLVIAGFAIKPVRTTLISIGAVFAYIGFSPLQTHTGIVVPVAVVQTNVPQDNKIGWSLQDRRRDFERFLELTREAASSDPRPALIVWPETMFPGNALDAQSLQTLRAAGLAYTDGTPFTDFADRLLALQAELGIPILVGAHSFEGFRVESTQNGFEFPFDAVYNSTVLIKDGAPQPQNYDKLHLTPFGEVMPYISWSDWLEAKLLSIGANGMSFNLDAGNNETVFEIDHGPARLEFKLRFATPICFEGTMPNVCRRLAYEDGEPQTHALIQLTNDGWFGSYMGGRETHALLARCRAIELGVAVVRAANTGISTAYDHDGEAIVSLPSHSDGVLTYGIAAYEGNWTLYARYLADTPSRLALLITFAALLLSFRKKKPQETTP